MSTFSTSNETPQPAAQPADRYVVVGHPIAHSKSPFIHARFAEQTHEPVVYEHLLAPLDRFVSTVREFVAQGGKGLNVTVPFKLEAHALAEHLSPRAAAAGAVNTLKVEPDGTLSGDNTDGVGLVRDIEHNLGVPLAGARLLLLGAGGASRGVVLPLLDAGVREIVIVNRTATKAAELAVAFDPTGTRVCGGDASLAKGVFDVIVNATAGSLDGDVPSYGEASVGPATLAYDMMYAAHPTVFMAHAAAQGARVADGLGMLVEQAAESFLIWRGTRPEGGPVLAQLRAMLDASSAANASAALTPAAEERIAAGPGSSGRVAGVSGTRDTTDRSGTSR